MAREIPWQDLSSSIAEILGEVKHASDEALSGAVRGGCAESKAEWRDNAPPGATGEYAKSITYRVTGSGDSIEGHVYSRQPGLPHLLEFGHAKVGGGSTTPKPHVADAAKSGFEKAESTLDELLGEYL